MMTTALLSKMIVRRRAHETLKPEENWLVNQFCRATQEYTLMVHQQVPSNHIVHFFYVGESPFAFLWTALQPNETGSTVLRVHALYLRKDVPVHRSKQITKHFEGLLTIMAKNAEAKEIGFYTRRNPKAFVRRLNRTSPKPWMLDSYVCIRRV